MPGTGSITRPAPVSPAEAERFERFLGHLAARGRRPATGAAYRADWQKFAAWSQRVNGDPFDVTRLVARELAEFRNAMVAKRAAPATVNRALAFAWQYTAWAAEHEGLPARVAAEAKKVPAVPQQPLAPGGMDRREVRRFLKEVDVRASPRDRAVVYLLLYTGIRLGELCGLDLGDVQLGERKGTLHVRSAAAKGGRERSVPVPREARLALAAYLERRGKTPGALFRGERGPLGRQGVTRVVRQFGRYAGRSLSPHALRHAFAYTYLERSGNDLVGLSSLLGHSSLNTTLVYTRKRFEDLEDAMEDLAFA
ncbi:MAG: tyrosine-type recombinase/integrase [Dehalococcoidia bacterium]